MSSQLAYDALTRIPGWSADNAAVVSHLGGSTTNESWLVEYEARRYVLRIDLPLAATLGLNRSNELLVREQVAAAGLAPGVIYASSDNAIVVSDYKAGRTWRDDDLHDPQNLNQLAKRLSLLHSLPPVGTKLNLDSTLARYANILGDPLSISMAQKARASLQNICSRPDVLCHNDLVARNIIAGDTLWLIDWEYAGMGDALFDLAVVIEHHHLSRNLARPFIEASLGYLNRQIENDLAIYKDMYLTLVTLWSAIAAK